MAKFFPYSTRQISKKFVAPRSFRRPRRSRFETDPTRNPDSWVLGSSRREISWSKWSWMAQFPIAVQFSSMGCVALPRSGQANRRMCGRLLFSSAACFSECSGWTQSNDRMPWCCSVNADRASSCRQTRVSLPKWALDALVERHMRGSGRSIDQHLRIVSFLQLQRSLSCRMTSCVGMWNFADQL